jgi:hypothetical protein
VAAWRMDSFLVISLTPEVLSRKPTERSVSFYCSKVLCRGQEKNLMNN